MELRPHQHHNAAEADDGPAGADGDRFAVASARRSDHPDGDVATSTASARSATVCSAQTTAPLPNPRSRRQIPATPLPPRGQALTAQRSMAINRLPGGDPAHGRHQQRRIVSSAMRMPR